MTPLNLLALEVNATWHCNLSCVGCSHASPVARPAVADPETVYRDLSRLAPVVAIREMRIVGGEPLSHPDLPGLLTAVRASGISGRLRVITNGTLLHRVSWEWVELVDDVHISRYPGTDVRQHALDELYRRGAALGKEVLVKDYHSFRLVWPAESLSTLDTRVVFDTCQVAHSWSCHTVEDGNVYLCPMSARGDVPATERCPIEPVEDLRDRLAAFLSRREPLTACRTCLGNVGNKVPHRQANRKTWLTLSRTGTVDRAQVAAIRKDKWADNGCVAND